MKEIGDDSAGHAQGMAHIVSYCNFVHALLNFLMPILPNGRYNIFTKGSTFLPSILKSQGRYYLNTCLVYNLKLWQFNIYVCWSKLCFAVYQILVHSNAGAHIWCTASNLFKFSFYEVNYDWPMTTTLHAGCSECYLDKIVAFYFFSM